MGVNRNVLQAMAVFSMMLMAACGNRVPEINQDTTKNNVIISIDSAGWPQSFGWGRRATKKMITAIDIDVSPNGRGLPHGNGNAIAGRKLYVVKCAACHGTEIRTTGIKLPAPLLFANPDSPQVKTIGNYWPYATTIFDYVRRTMPYNAPGSLTDNEVYAITAYLLEANQLLDSSTVLDAKSLPKIVMPAQTRFIADDRRGGPVIK